MNSTDKILTAIYKIVCKLQKNLDAQNTVTDNGYSHDFVGELTLDNASLLAQSGSSNSAIDSIDIDVRSGTATYTRGGASTVIYPNGSRSFGNRDESPLEDGWTVTIPAGAEVVVTWDEIV